MNLRRLIPAALAAGFLFIVVTAQTPRRPPASRTAAPKPSPTATPAAAAPSPQPVTNPASPALAVMGDTTIAASDIEADVSAAIMRDPDPYLRDYYTDPAKAIRAARERAVDARVASMLIAAEAKKRGKTPNDIIEAEINSRVPRQVSRRFKPPTMRIATSSVAPIWSRCGPSSLTIFAIRRNRNHTRGW